MNTYENISQETPTTIPLTDIVVPSLNDVNYAAALNGVFENINNNFKTLANHEFVKGDKGKSVEIVEYPFFYPDDLIIDEFIVDKSFQQMNLPESYRRFFDGTENYYGNLLKKAILSLSNNEKDYDDANGYTIFDNFTKDTAGNIQMLVNTDDINDESAPASSLYYVFTDGRFANKNLGAAEESQYVNIKDFSCILVYTAKLKDDKGNYIKDEDGNFIDGFEVLNNAFPTMYYEKNVGLCWKLNGVTTGIPVKGAAGKDGKDANIIIVSTEPFNESNELGDGVTIKVTGIYENYFGYTNIIDYSDEALEDFNGRTALVLIPNETGNLFYFGSLLYDIDKNDDTKKVLYAQCSPGTSINSAITTENIINILKNININYESTNASSGLKGLFIPIENNNTDSQKVHLLSATSITDGFDTIKSDFLFTPISDINNLSVSENNEFEVNKYLYIKIPATHKIFNSNKSNINVNDFKKYNYCLKYKLTNFIKSKESVFLNENTAEGKKSMYFGSGLNANNVTYLTLFEDGDNSTTITQKKYVDKSIDTLPFEFRRRLDNTDGSSTGIYKWTLCEVKNDFDIDDLKYAAYSYSFPACFNSIYTTDITPSATSNIMWFDGITTYETKNGKTVINGWTPSFGVIDPNNELNINNSFEFIKFVPVYNIDNHKINVDTALNLNYNVNITGDEAEYKRNLNVTGDITCDNIVIDGKLHVDSIDKVYTENDIETKGNLKLNNCQITSGNIDTTGNIKTQKNISGTDATLKGDVTAENAIISNTINAGKVINIDNNSISVTDNGTEVKLNNTYKINIGANTNVSNDVSKVPNITNALSTVNRNGSTISVFNGTTVDNSVFFKGAPTDCVEDGVSYVGGSGISEDKNVKNASFESAKNFNMHRLSFQSKSNISESERTEISDPISIYLSEKYDSVYGKELNRVSFPLYTYHPGISYTECTNPFLTLNINTKDLNIPYDSDVTFNFNDTVFVFNIECVCNRSTSSYFTHEHGEFTIKCEVNSNDHVIMRDIPIILCNTPDWSVMCGRNTNGGSLINSYELIQRNYQVAFRFPSNIKFKSNEDTLNIKFYFNCNLNLISYPYNSDSLKIESIRLYQPVPFNVNKVSGTGGPGGTITLGYNNDFIKYTDIPLTSGGEICKITYKYTVKESSENVEESNIKSTIICNDGIVTRAGKYVFGLGFAENVVNHKVNGYEQLDTANPHWNIKVTNDSAYRTRIPVLFYHEYSSNYYESTAGGAIPTNDGLRTSKGYAQRTNAIPLDDLFNMLRSYNESDTAQYGL